MAIKGGEGCAWNAITKRIAREHPKRYGAEHPPGELSRSAFMKCVESVAEKVSKGVDQRRGAG